jgi:hypothetical protein
MDRPTSGRVEERIEGGAVFPFLLMREFPQSESTLFPEGLGDWISEDNPVRVIDVFVDELDLAELGFNGVEPEVTGRPSYHRSF